MSAVVVESATNLRHQCLQVMLQLQRSGGSLTRLLPEAQQRVALGEQSQLQAWSFGWCRWSHELSGLVDQLLDKPMKPKDLDVYLLMQLGVFQLRHTPTAAHAAVDETVKVTKRISKPWARGLINAVLRNYQRQQQSLEAALSNHARHSHPPWLLARFKTDWPSQWEALCAANNLQAPMCLRVNRQHGSVASYQTRLEKKDMAASTLANAPDALVLETPVPVFKLPGFDQGDVSIQDGAAQRVQQWLARYCKLGARLLDACAAPGGKTAHAAESGLFSHITAIDCDQQRLASVSATMQRLQLRDSVDVVHADASQPAQWWDGRPYDAILLDAPCSGTGVIRRHPDIKLLRRETDIANLMANQKDLLDALWGCLAQDGVLLYATCSILKDENEHQASAFMQRTSDAVLLEAPCQVFPGDNGTDGFFYAAMQKRTL